MLKMFNLLFLCLFFYIAGCASSHVSREANDNVTVGYQNAYSSFSNLGNGNIADTYDNLNQSQRGMLLGGTAGAVVGGLTSGVGVIPGLATGAIFAGAYGAYIDSKTTLVDRLQNRGVKVITLGDNVMIVMHSNQLFHAMTPVIRPGAYSTLDLVTAYINTMTTMTVRVAAFTHATGPAQIDRALSKEQAESIVRYLWQRGINTRMLTAVGMGGVDLVSPNSLDWDKGDNYRIEITMVKLPTVGTLG